MKTLLFIIPFLLFQEVTTRETIFSSNQLGDITLLKYGSNTLISFTAQNAKYRQIVDIITVFGGTPDEFAGFLKKANEFYSQNDLGSSVEIGGQLLYISKYKPKALSIYNKEKTGYQDFNLKQLQKITDAYFGWYSKQ